MIAHFIVGLKATTCVEQTEERKEPATSSATAFRAPLPTLVILVH
jgi:hypothetical protein